MKSRWIAILLFIAVLGGAAAIRLPGLSGRPMHTDEAIHAIKFGDLLEKGQYEYDPFEYHGPSLNYFTLIPAWLAGQKTILETTELTLRIVPVFFGVLLIVLLLRTLVVLPWPVVLLAGALTAVSPSMVYYSGYYIQEILLVCFSFGMIVAGMRYLRNPRYFWAIAAGIFAGLMHASKETCILIWAAMGLAGLVQWGIARKFKSGPAEHSSSIRFFHLAAGFLAFLTVSILFYSSFLTHPRGILDSLSFFAYYVDRAGDNPLHIHPWYYYFSLFGFYRFADGPLWSEALIIIPAIPVMLLAFRKNSKIAMPPFIRFLALYTLILTVIYSAIPYKTPWCFLGPLHGMILLSAWIIWRLFQLSFLPARILLCCFCIVELFYFVMMSFLATHQYRADCRSPYVYAHTGEDIFPIVNAVQAVAKHSSGGDNTPIQVICAGHDYWPLPWYLRRFPHIYWWDKPDSSVPPAPLVIAAASLENQVIPYLYSPPPGQKNLYIPLWKEYRELRPTLELRGYITYDLQQEYLLGREQNRGVPSSPSAGTPETAR